MFLKQTSAFVDNKYYLHHDGKEIRSVAQKPSKSLSAPQVLAGALASITAAVVASRIGVAGTVLGAALSSVTVTIAGTWYTQSLEKAHERLHRRDRRRLELADQILQTRPWYRRYRMAWGAVLAGTVLVFVISMGSLTAVEALAKAPVAKLMGQHTPKHSWTTVGALIKETAPPPSSTPIPDPAPSDVVPEPTPSPAPLWAPSTQSSAQPEEVAPSPSPPESPEPKLMAPVRPSPSVQPRSTPPTPSPSPVDNEKTPGVSSGVSSDGEKETVLRQSGV